ncbi:MAG TPA: carboxylesterase family protein [Acidimicrobiia bacterium]|jgi:para-nitrobenzyl esterase|nr:carboxylesterase family protein [Acidimicrobiia bacterium]
MSEVDTTAGRLIGTTDVVAGTTVHVFRGVQYATASRFQAPVPVTSWTGARDATTFSPAAPQPIGGPLDGLVPGGFNGATDEHACLTLNIWSPDPNGRATKPVLVWFPGGAFTTGAASQPVYDGARFCAEQDAVIVTCNYRLGALGFLDMRAAGGVANCGLRDAIAALGWVRDNIAAFGGDPAQVAMFGESAGGGIVLHVAAAPAARGLYRGAIVQSGATFNTLDPARAALVLDALLAELGLDDARHLIDVPVDALLLAQATAQGTLLPSVGMMPFHPMVDADVLASPPVEALSAGSAAGIPLVVGTTIDEMRLFLDLSGEPPTRDRLGSRVAKMLGTDTARADAIVTTYEAALATTDTNEIWAAIFSDIQMQIPADAMRDAHRAHGPTYSYLFTWPAVNPYLGACHGIDIPFTFGNFVSGWAEFVGADDAARSVGRAIRDAWVNVARSGEPGWAPTPITKVFAREPLLAEDPLRARLDSITK